MRLRTKIGLLVVGVSLLGAMTALTLVSGILTRSFSDLENAQMLGDARRAYGFLEQQYDSMRGSVYDWSVWDDTYRFAGGEDPTYVEANLPPDTFKSLKLDAIGFVDEGGRLSALFTPEGRTDLDRAPPAVRELFPGGRVSVDVPASYVATAGVIVPATGAPMIVSLCGIFKSDRTGPRRGTLVMCRALDAEGLAAAMAYLGLPLRISRGAPPADTSAGETGWGASGETYSAVVVGDTTIAGYVAVPDLRRGMTFTLRTEEKRVISQAGRTTTGWLALFIVLAAPLGGVVFLFAFDRSMARPLSRLAADMLEIEKGGDYHGRVMVTSRDEVGDVASAANRMLGALGTARSKLEDMHGQLESLVHVRTAELEQTNRDLREATQARDRLLANMSHELRTPLNSIIGFSSLLSRGMAGELNDEQSRQVAMIQASGERLSALVTQILDLSRLETDAAPPHATDFQVCKAVEALVGSLTPSARRKGLDLSLLLPPSCPLVHTDRGFFDGIVLNIVGNAIKYTEEGSVTVTLTIGDDTLELSVADTGPGIPQTDLGSIFEDFSQLPVRDTAKSQGAGLGLAISRRCAVLLGGTIAVSSTVGQGSVFVLTLPLRSDRADG